MRYLQLGPLWLTLLVLGCSDSENLMSAEYRDLAVPEERLASAEARRSGRELFLRHCAICHGERADGRGLRRHSLSTPPADFTRRDWRQRTTERDLYQVIREGVHGTPMPAWKALEEGETWDIVAYVAAVADFGSDLGEPSAAPPRDPIQ